jgi:serine/threonine protein kinase/Flp pilus assembly protein TadD
MKGRDPRPGEDSPVDPADADLDEIESIPDIAADELISTVDQLGAPVRPRPQSPISTPASIGPYRILGRLGEGGMGVVFEAEQQRPRRRVALKVVRGGQFVDEQQVRMFQREADTLARLKHPNIGAIYESGCTDDGQHFFAMELVHGETLDVHLEQRPRTLDRRELEQRLRLFRKIVDAVHYAHQRGVIHRDLKPSNIIVTEPGDGDDGAPDPDAPGIKILDFGLARITDTDVAAPTMLTEVGTIRGTLPYMSPEQTGGNPEEIDVRADVYALGVILYEMLTDTKPYATDNTGLIEAVRIICEEAPKPLSQNWSGTRRPNADLETIVHKALEKDVERRYGSAAALSEDIGRYLARQPILARPPSAVYQLRKLVSRHKLGFAFATTLALLLLGFGIGMSVLYARAVDAEGQASREAETAERALRFMIGLFETSDPSEAQGNTITAREILDQGAEKIEVELEAQPEVQARLMGTMGWVYRGLGLYEEAEPLLERSLEIRRRALGPDHQDTLLSMNDLAVLYANRGRYAEAERLHVEALEGQRRVLGSEHGDTLRSMINLAVVHGRNGRYAEAEQLYSEAAETQRRVLGPDHAATLGSVNNLAVFYTARGRYDEAEPLHRAALEGRRRVLGQDHPETLNSMTNLAVLYDKQGRLDLAEPLYLQGLESQRRVLGEDHPETLTSAYNLGNVYLRQGRLDDARLQFLAALEGQRRALGDDHPDSLDTLYNLACVSSLQGRKREALDYLGEALDLGYTYGGDPAGMLTDPDLSALHTEPGFAAIAERIRGLSAS